MQGIYPYIKQLNWLLIIEIIILMEEVSFDSVKQSSNLIKKLLCNIQAATACMNVSFQQTIIRHQQQFIKCYKIKIYELIKLFQQLKSTIQDKFINNTLAIQLQTVLKERDYFKYQCLKLNSQHQTLLDDHNNVTAQANNSTQQINIYKHLLENQKIRTHQIENNLHTLKKNITEIASKTIPQVRVNNQIKSYQIDREINRFKRQLRQKNQVIRALRERVQELERAISLQHQNRVQKKELYQLFKICVQGWRRQVKMKSKKDLKNITIEQISSLNKKQLLKTLFTHSQFLKFIQRLLFDEGLKVSFQCVQQDYMQKNRMKLVQFMSKKRIYTSPRGIRL